MSSATTTPLDEALRLVREQNIFSNDDQRVIREGAALLNGRADTANERRLEYVATKLTIVSPPSVAVKIVTPFDDEVAVAKAARDAAFTEEGSARDELFDARDDRYRLLQYELVYEGHSNSTKRLYRARDSTPATREAALARVERAEDRHLKAEHDLAAANARFGRANQRREHHVIAYGLR